MEALYLKTPVIATNCVDFSGVIQDGVNGFVVQKNDVGALRRAMQAALVHIFDVQSIQIENFDYNQLFV